MAGRSVRWTVAVGKSNAAAMPTRPVPAPSSRTRGDRLRIDEDVLGTGAWYEDGRTARRSGRRLASRYEASHVLWPRLSAVREGS